MRIHEFAKSIGVTGKELLQYLSRQGVVISSSSAAMPAHFEKKAAAYFGGEAAAPAPPKPAKPAAPARPAAKPAPPVPHEAPPVTPTRPDRKMAPGRGPVQSLPMSAVRALAPKPVPKPAPVAPRPEREKEKEREKEPAKKPVPARARAAVTIAPPPPPGIRTGEAIEFGPKRPVAPAPAPKPVAAAPVAAPPKDWKGTIKITDPVRVNELAEKMNQPVGEVIGMLIKLGKMVRRNDRIDAVSATLVAEEAGWHTEIADLFKEEKKAMITQAGDRAKLKPRAPIVTVMGHVDHGKTTLLDVIRSTSVAEGESGGITQHIGASKVTLPKGEIVFIDTPGHEAFTAMRARGAEVTDLVLLVVAADDGVRPQTDEAINHAKQANVPIIVVINKIDLPGANLERVKKELAERGLIPEEWGGKTLFAEVSAKHRKGVDALLETILLQAEMMDLKADPDCPAVGTVLEARLDPRLGPVATVMVQKGTLRPGQSFVIGVHSGKVRALFDEAEHKLAAAGPSTAVLIAGISDVPQAGDLFMVVAGEKEARQLSDQRQTLKTESDQRQQKGLTMFDLQQQIAEGKLKQFNLLLKTDVDGSIEAIREVTGKFEHAEVVLNWIATSTGGITEGDIYLAAASKAVIIGYRVRPTAAVRQLAEREGVEIRTYTVIYELQDELKKAVEGMLSPEVREKLIGTVTVKEVFKIGKLGNIAGCIVEEGKVRRTARARLIRNQTVVWEGKISSLRHFKDEVSELAAGQECGIGLENYHDIKVGDIIEAVEVSEVAVKL